MGLKNRDCLTKKYPERISECLKNAPEYTRTATSCVSYQRFGRTVSVQRLNSFIILYLPKLQLLYAKLATGPHAFWKSGPQAKLSIAAMGQVIREKSALCDYTTLPLSHTHQQFKAGNLNTQKSCSVMSVSDT